MCVNPAESLWVRAEHQPLSRRVVYIRSVPVAVSLVVSAEYDVT